MTVPAPDVSPSNSPARKSADTRVLDWWTLHCDPREGDPGTRARLRRCRSTVDALSIPAAVSLARRLGTVREGTPENDRRLATALDLSRVLAHVTAHSPERLMRAAGWLSFPGDSPKESGENRPRLAEVRFRRLLETGSGEEQVSAFVRLIALLDGVVNISQIAEDFMSWSHPYRGDRIRQRWAFDYYAAGIAAPADSSTDEDDDA